MHIRGGSDHPTASQTGGQTLLLKLNDAMRINSHCERPLLQQQIGDVGDCRIFLLEHERPTTWASAKATWACAPRPTTPRRGSASTPRTTRPISQGCPSVTSNYRPSDGTDQQRGALSGEGLLRSAFTNPSKPAGVPVPAGQLQDGKTYQFRTNAFDGTTTTSTGHPGPSFVVETATAGQPTSLQPGDSYTITDRKIIADPVKVQEIFARDGSLEALGLKPTRGPPAPVGPEHQGCLGAQLHHRRQEACGAV